MRRASTFYDTLRIKRTASQADIKASYRRLCQKFHPDKKPDDIASATKAMKSLNEAYEVLSDPDRRAGYDSTLDELDKRYEQEEAARRKEHAAYERQKQEQAEQRAKEQAEIAARNAAQRAKEQAEIAARNAAQRAYEEKTRAAREASSSQERDAAWRHHEAVRENARSRYTSNGQYPSSAPPKTARLKYLKDRAWMLVVGYIVYNALYWISSNHGSTGAPSIVDSEKQPVQMVIANSAPIGSNNPNSVYTKMSAELQAKYPFLDPSSPQYRPELAQEMMRRMAQFENRGLAQHVALKLAVEEAVAKILPKLPAQNAPTEVSIMKAELQAKYPFLDPSSPQYRPELAQKMMRRMAQFESRGLAQHVALKIAVEEAVGQAHANQPSQQVKNSDVRLKQHAVINSDNSDKKLTINLTSTKDVRQGTVEAISLNPTPSPVSQLPSGVFIRVDKPDPAQGDATSRPGFPSQCRWATPIKWTCE